MGPNSYSAVEEDHKAFLWWAPERLAVVPAVQYGPGYEGTAFAGTLAYRVDRAGGIAPVAQIAHPSRETFGISSFDRSVVVGGRLLLVSRSGVLSTFLNAPGPGQFVAYRG